ncbi:MAG TPA: 3-hydroxyacyl-CoA dehydrogenase family protein [Thermoanaerobaculia bacterium]|nr:3-hydroxyacyl-CoA dehydrogenase family protein [Thermoanaerobaculia bacterium]
MSEETRIRRVAVCGAGTMGRGIAALCVSRGFETAMHDPAPPALAAAPERVAALLEKARARGKMTDAEFASAAARLRTASSVEDATRDADLVVEAAPESLELKSAIFSELDRIVPDAILATNTSSLSIAKIAAAARRPGRVIGLHFFNPPLAMPLVEIVVGPETSPAVLAQARAFVASLGKEAIEVRDSPGFATSRLGVALGLEAMRMVEEGVATAADIDRAMEAGYGHAMGPLKTSDLVGLDVLLAIADALARELSDERFRAPALLRKLVAEGKTGKKAGEGFYRWEGNEAIPVPRPR